MSDDLVKQLRRGDAMDGMTVNCKHDRCNCAVMDEAADRIEELEARLANAVKTIEDCCEQLEQAMLTQTAAKNFALAQMS